MFVIFIVDNSFALVYICLKERYPDALRSLGIHISRVKSVTVSMESLAMLWDKQMHHICLYK